MLPDTITADPRLGPLADNGGPSRTTTRLPACPALDAGSNALVSAGATTDQRGPGFRRVRRGECGLGAFEVQVASPPTLAWGDPSLSVYEGSRAANGGTFDDLDGRNGVTLTASLGTLVRDAAAGT